MTYITSALVKTKAKEFGADLVGIASGAVLDAHPPDAKHPQTPSLVSPRDNKSVIVLAKRHLTGTGRLKDWNERHKQYAAELTLSQLEEASLKLVYFLEDEAGYPALIIPPVHTDAARNFAAYMEGGTYGALSLVHAAVEAGLGTLGLNLMLLTPEYGPRVILTAVLTSAELEPDRRLTQPLCVGEACGRCLLACPGDAVLQWGLEKKKCAPYASPHGFAHVVSHVGNVLRTESVEQKVELLRGGDSFNIWQTMLRGVGAYTGCTRCVDVCPVGQDYARHLQDVQEHIPETTAEKMVRLTEMQRKRAAGETIEGLERSRRWIGESRNES
jgi:epoxyqueuosine reductase QueG